MGLITKTVKVKWNGKNKKHYVDLGYVYTKIGDEFEVKVEDLTKGNESRVLYKCDNCKNIFETSYSKYLKKIENNKVCYCQKCSTKLIATKKSNKNRIKKSKSFEEWCIENDRQDVLNRWDYDLNDYKPSEICYSSNKKYWFKCDKHPEHKSELKNIQSFIIGYNSIKCIQCNSIAQWMIDNDLKIEDYWDYDKNILNPWELTCGSDKTIYIKCQEKDYHGSYETTPKHIVKGYRCPYCYNCSVHPKDSLGKYIIDNYGEDFLWNVWSNKNKKSPFEYKINSNQKVWWKCLNNTHKEYYRIIQSSYDKEFRCPQCSQKRTESIIEEKTRLYLESLGYIILHEHNCTINPINPKTNHYMRYDNEIILDNGNHLIIEVNGEQHYKTRKDWVNGNRTPEQQLHYQQVKDRYKRIYAIQNGYSYLEIPYTAFDKQETYKKLINDKIKQIKNE